MYKCENCGKLQQFATKEDQVKAKNLKTQPKLPTSALTLIIETRPKNYVTKKTKKVMGKIKETIIRSEGNEIVREWDLCEECYGNLRPKHS